MGKKILTEIGQLIYNHPYISCSLLVLFTPPFFPVLKYFSPLLISTALFVVALVTLGPHFESSSEHADGKKASKVKISEDKAGVKEDVDGERQAKRQKSGWMDKFKNEGKKSGASLSDENVSILQEAFPKNSEEKDLGTSNGNKKEDASENVLIPEGSVSGKHHELQDVTLLDSWNSGEEYGIEYSDSKADRSFKDTRDLPHDIFFPPPSLTKIHDGDLPFFEDVMPPPIEHDMPPLVTGPASITDPLLNDAASESDDEFNDDDIEYGEDVIPTAEDQMPDHQQPGSPVRQPADLEEHEEIHDVPELEDFVPSETKVQESPALADASIPQVDSGNVDGDSKHNESDHSTTTELPVKTLENTDEPPNDSETELSSKDLHKEENQTDAPPPENDNVAAVESTEIPETSTDQKVELGLDGEGIDGASPESCRSSIVQAAETCEIQPVPQAA